MWPTFGLISTVVKDKPDVSRITKETYQIGNFEISVPSDSTSRYQGSFLHAKIISKFCNESKLAVFLLLVVSALVDVHGFSLSQRYSTKKYCAGLPSSWTRMCIRVTCTCHKFFSVSIRRYRKGPDVSTCRKLVPPRQSLDTLLPRTAPECTYTRNTCKHPPRPGSPTIYIVNHIHCKPYTL